jgi:transposase
MSRAEPCSELELPHDDVESLKREVAHLRAQLEARDEKLARREVAIARLEERIRLLLAQRFGASSERIADGQLGLFNEAEELAASEGPEDEEVEVTGHRRRRRGKRGPLPEHLPRVDVVHELAEHERVCPHDGTALESFDEEVSEQLDVEPARFRVLRHRRKKYRCPCCREHLRTAPMTPQPVPKSVASPGLLAFITTAKYVDGLPLYRLSKQFERVEVPLPRQTMARWMVQCGELVQPLVNLLRERMLEGEVVHCDETTVQVLEEPGREANSKSYMWVQASGSTEQPVVLFDYDPSRGGHVPKRLFADFHGYLQTDAYSGYDEVVRENGITRVLCMAHARRYFVDGLKAQGINPNKLPAKPPDKARRLLTALGYFRGLYEIERRIRGRDPEERYAVRQAESRPKLERFHAWARALRPKVPPSTPLGKALAYLLEHWEGLTRFLDDGRLEIDNNRAENAIRPFTVGRRSWLFSATVEGAHASANLYSLVETAKANGLEPYAYLRQLFTELPKAGVVEDIEALLPWNVPRESLKL